MMRPSAHAVDAGKDRLHAGGELDLQQLVARGGADGTRHDVGGQQRRAFGREGDACRRLRHIQRLDAERVARQRDGAAGAVVDGERIHAAQRAGEVGGIADKPLQRHLVVAVGGEMHLRHRCAQLAVVVDLAVADEGGGTREQRLVAGHEVDDRQPVVHQRHAPDDGVAGAIRAAMGDAAFQRAERRGVGLRRIGRGDDAGDAAHQARRVLRVGQRRFMVGPV